MSSADDAPTRVSWDNARAMAPGRPRFEPGIAPVHEPPQRPRRLLVALISVIIAVGITVWSIVNVLAHYDEVSDALTTVIITELDDSYADNDMTIAINVLLGITGFAMLLLSATHLLSASFVRAKRSRQARNWFVISVSVFVPIAALAALFQDAADFDLAISAAAALLLCVALVLVITPRSSRWLAQVEQQARRPLITAEAS